MAGLDPAIYEARRDEWPEASYETKSLLRVVAMSASSLRRRCVDGRVKPGHDGKRFGAQPSDATKS
jgi:hypothetical protein